MATGFRVPARNDGSSIFRRVFLALAFALFSAAAFAIDPMTFKDPAEEARFQALLRELRCLVCQNQNLADSDADLARDLRHEIFDLMRQGKSDLQIKDFLHQRYGDFVLYKPPVQGNTFVLWFGPFVVLGIGAIALIAIVRRRSNALPADLPPEEPN